MKLKKIILSFLIMLVAAIAWADGPPINEKGEITTDHITFYLNEDQIKEVGISRVLTLDKKQAEILKIIFCGVDIRRIEVITPSYSNCACDLFPYAIWNAKNKVSLPIVYLDCAAPPLDSADSPPFHSKKQHEYIPYVSEGKKGWYGPINIDSEGDFYFKNKQITEYEIYKIIKKMAKIEDKDDPVIFFSLPPKIQDTIEKKIGNTLYNIFIFGEKNNVKIYVHF